MLTLKEFLTQNIQNTMKRATPRIIGIEEESKLKNRENIFNQILEGNFPNLKKDIPTKGTRNLQKNLSPMEE